MSDDVITDELRAFVGRATEPWTYEVTTTGIRAFARGVGYTDPVYYEQEAAKAASYPSLPAPPTFVGTPVFVPGQSDDVFSSPPAGDPLPHGLSHVLDGGTDLRYERTLLAGEVLAGRSKLVALETKRSPTLGVLLFVTTETVLHDAAGAVAVTETAQTIHY